MVYVGVAGHSLQATFIFDGRELGQYALMPINLCLVNE